MNHISVGTVKAWELNKKSETLGVCIPKMAKTNLNLSKDTKFKVTINMNAKQRQIILEAVEE